MATPAPASDAVASTADSSPLFVYINGEKRALLDDYRLALYQYFPAGTALFDPSYVPSRRIPLVTSGEEFGFTRRKLLPTGHYEAYFEDSDSGALFPIGRQNYTCVYVTGLPPNTTAERLGRFFETFDHIKAADVFRGANAPCSGRGYAVLHDTTKLALVPRVMQFYSSDLIYTELSDRDPEETRIFGPLPMPAPAPNGSPAPLGPPDTPGPRGGAQWQHSAPPAAVAAAPAAAAHAARPTLLAAPRSALEAAAKPLNPNLPQPRSSKVQQQQQQQGPAPPLPRGLATAAGGAPPPPPPAGTPAPRSAFAAGPPRPAGLPHLGGADVSPFDGDGTYGAPPSRGGVSSSLSASPAASNGAPSTVYIVTYIADSDAPDAVRDGVFWPTQAVQHQLKAAEDNGYATAVVFFLLQHYPGVFGYGRLALPYRQHAARNGLYRIEWVRHHLYLREHALRNANAQVLLKIHDGAVVKPSIGVSACDLADASPSTAPPIASPQAADIARGGRPGFSGPARQGLYSPTASAPAAPVALAGAAPTAAARSAVRPAAGAGHQARPRPLATSEGPSPIPIPVPASRRGQAMATSNGSPTSSSPRSPGHASSPTSPAPTVSKQQPKANGTNGTNGASSTRVPPPAPVL